MGYKLSKKAERSEKQYESNLKKHQDEISKWESILEADGLGVIGFDQSQATASIPTLDETLSYYSTTSSYGHTGQFKDSMEKQIWDLHSQGLSVRKICQAVGLKSPESVHRRIKRIRQRAFKKS